RTAGGQRRSRRFRSVQGDHRADALERYRAAPRGRALNMPILRSWWLAALVCMLALTTGVVAHSEANKPELSNVRLAVGGKPALFYLPLTITERLGYFREQGLAVEISDFPGGARALQALIGGSADVVTGSYDHTIQMQAKNQPIVAVVLLPV